MYGAVGASVPLAIAIGWVRDVGLREHREVNDRVGDRIGAPEGDDYAPGEWRVGERDIAAGVGEKGASVPCLGRTFSVARTRMMYKLEGSNKPFNYFSP